MRSVAIAEPLIIAEEANEPETHLVKPDIRDWTLDSFMLDSNCVSLEKTLFPAADSSLP